MRAELRPQVLHGFTSGITFFESTAVPGPDGNYYGFSPQGGKYADGVMFKVVPGNPASSEILVSFGNPNSGARGKGPVRTPVYDGVQYFYGTTTTGGRFGEGTIFRATLTGVVETVVDLTGSEGVAPGYYPSGGLVKHPDGNFYGLASYGGANDCGVFFRVSPEGRYQALRHLTGRGGSAPGEDADAPLLVMPDGTFIGVAREGGKFDAGVIFRLTTTGAYELLGTFTGDSGAFKGRRPGGPLALGLDGSVYGLYSQFDQQTFESRRLMWKMPPGGRPAPFVSLDLDSNGDFVSPLTDALAVLPSGDIIGSAQLGAYIGVDQDGLGLFRVTPSGQVLPYLSAGTLSPVYFSFPYGTGLVVNDGNIFASIGDILFKVPSGGSPELLAKTLSDNGTGEGTNPTDTLLVTNDAVVGHTRSGGTNNGGTLFRLELGGSLTILRNLMGPYYYGPNPVVPLGSDVLFANDGFDDKIFRVDPSGVTTEFADAAGGEVNSLSGGLIKGDGTNFYGHGFTFLDDGMGNFEYGPAIYRLTSLGAIEPVGAFTSSEPDVNFYGPLTWDGVGALLAVDPYSFQGDSSGRIFKMTLAGAGILLTDFSSGNQTIKPRFPQAPLLPEPGGSFLVAMQSDSKFGEGSIVRISPSGATQKVLQFTGYDGAAPGSSPLAPMVRTAAGRVFGVTRHGGDVSNGVLYRLDPDGAYSKLYEFDDGADPTSVGRYPEAGLTLGPDGYIYGTTGTGGPEGGGTVFRFSPTPDISGSTAANPTVTPNSAIIEGLLNSNGYGGEYWFTYGLEGATQVETPHQIFSAFSGEQTLGVTLTGLKGHRSYTFTFYAKAGLGADIDTTQGTTVTFTTPNGAPIAENDSILVTTVGLGVAGNVLENDYDPDDDPVTIESFTQGTHGTVTLDGTKLVYTPTDSFPGEDTFTYTIKDDQDPALTATATVNVLSDGAIAGEYAGLLFDADDVVAALPDGAAAALTVNQIAAGFANFALTKNRKYTARFEIGSKTVTVKGSMSPDRDTRVSGKLKGGDRMSGSFRPAVGGAEGRITIGGKTLVFRAGQAFAAGAAPIQRPKSDFTMRLSPDEVEDPVNAAGIPAGSGFAVVRRLGNASARLVGVLPDGTAFSKKSVVDKDGNMPFLVKIYKDKLGSIEGSIVIDPDGDGLIDPDPNKPTFWQKTPQRKDKRFVGGFSTTMTAFGGKYTPPPGGKPPIDSTANPALLATFDRGGLFRPLKTRFTFNKAKLVPDPNNDAAKATAKLEARTGFVTGKFKPVKAAVKYRGVVVQRDQTCAGFFLGTADTGSVVIEPEDD